MSCPDDNALAEYVDNVLPPIRRGEVDQHIDTCAACRTIVSDLARMQHAAAAGDLADVAESAHTTIAAPPTMQAPVRPSAGTIAAAAAAAGGQRKKTAQIVPGTMIGEYEVKGVLGAGGMGIVFAAVHPRIGKKAAIKILKRDFALDDSAIVRFENEARAVNAIGHQNIVDIFAFGELPNGDPYYVMEHIDGKSLQDWISSRSPCSLALALPILRQICDALSAAHSHGIIHRDLKPGNIMVGGSDDAPRVTVLDFGLAKMVRTDDSLGDELTHPGVAMGTPAFMSPEQFMGREVDQRTDVYAFGVLVYLMLTARYPFLGATPSAIGQQHLYHTPLSPSDLANLPERMDHIIAKALAKDAAARYATIADFRRDLEACAVEVPTRTRTAPIVIDSPKATPDASTMAPRPAVAAPTSAEPDASTLLAATPITAPPITARPITAPPSGPTIIAPVATVFVRAPSTIPGPAVAAPAFPAPALLAPAVAAPVVPAPAVPVPAGPRVSGWLVAASASVAIAAGIIWFVNSRSDAQTSATQADDQVLAAPPSRPSASAPPAGTTAPPATSPPVTAPDDKPTPTEVAPDDKPIPTEVVEDHATPPPVTDTPSPPTTANPPRRIPRTTTPRGPKTTKPPRTGSGGAAAVDDDRMLLPGGTVKPKK